MISEKKIIVFGNEYIRQSASENGTVAFLVDTVEGISVL
jgi:hypothetical protein